MFFGRQDDIQRKSPGLRIVDNQLNKRNSDIFNVKGEVTVHKPENYYEMKRISAQTNEERINKQLRVN